MQTGVIATESIYEVDRGANTDPEEFPALLDHVCQSVSGSQVFIQVSLVRLPERLLPVHHPVSITRGASAAKSQTMKHVSNGRCFLCLCFSFLSSFHSTLLSYLVNDKANVSCFSQCTEDTLLCNDGDTKRG